MGNWRTVHIVGKCGKDDIGNLKKALSPGANYENFHCLVCGGICGLQNWATEEIDVAGNLAERDFGIDDVKDQLRKLADIAPSLVVDIHCGGDYENKDCINTVRLHPSGRVEVIPPQEEVIPEISEVSMQHNLMNQLIMGMQPNGKGKLPPTAAQNKYRRLNHD